jgi:hypothetical protein
VLSEQGHMKRVASGNPVPANAPIQRSPRVAPPAQEAAAPEAEAAPAAEQVALAG